MTSDNLAVRGSSDGGRSEVATAVVRAIATHAYVIVPLVLGLLVVGGQRPAAAHAGSELPTAIWDRAEGREVTGTWTAPPDDAAWIGESLGLLPDGSMEAYLGGPGDAYPSDAELAALGVAPELEEYLLEHVRIRQEGADCDGEVEVADDFVADGASFRFTCPDEVGTAEIRITILHEQDDSFRTFSGDGTLQDALHTAARPGHDWDFTAAGEIRADDAASADATSRRGSDGRSPTWPLLVGGLAVVGVGLTALAVLGRPGGRGVRRRRATR